MASSSIFSFCLLTFLAVIFNHGDVGFQSQKYHLVPKVFLSLKRYSQESKFVPGATKTCGAKKSLPRKNHGPKRGGKMRGKGRKKKEQCSCHTMLLLFLLCIICPSPFTFFRKLNLAACLEAQAVMSCFIKALIFQLDLYACCLMGCFFRFTRTVPVSM